MALQQLAETPPPPPPLEKQGVVADENGSADQDFVPYKAIEHWANFCPERKALIHAAKPWKVKKGTLKQASRVVDNTKWDSTTYKQLHTRVNQFRNVLQPYTNQQVGYKIILFFLPKSRPDFLALIVSLQACGYTILAGSPAEFGGMRKWIEKMLDLQPQGVLATPFGHRLFRWFAARVQRKRKEKQVVINKQQLQWIDASPLLLVEPNSDNETVATTSCPAPTIPPDTPFVVMFSSGTTGPPTPAKISHRMQSFQAGNYASTIETYLPQQQQEPSSHSYYISGHMFLNFVLLDLCLGGTAVLQPMGVVQSKDTVCPVAWRKMMERFRCQVSSAPPALWERLYRHCDATPSAAAAVLPNLTIAFVGGAETSPGFCTRMTKLLPRSGKAVIARVYGSTQVLPIASVTATTVLQDEERTQRCALGGGVCLGTSVDGVQVHIECEAWRAMGGVPQLDLAHHAATGAGCNVDVGEICVRGKPLSPTLPQCDDDDDRLFCSGDMGYIDPTTQNIFFLGRKSQSVKVMVADNESKSVLIPPAAVEMVVLQAAETIVAHCALVADKRKDGTAILVLLPRDRKSLDREQARQTLQGVLRKSIWGKYLRYRLSIVWFLPSRRRQWPVDRRHSSKVNRSLLCEWANSKPQVPRPLWDA